MSLAPTPPRPVWRAFIWLLAAGALCAVGLLGWFLYESAYSPRAQAARERAAEAVALAREAAAAPGAAELRAAGCAEAYVLDLDRARALGIDTGAEAPQTVIVCRAPERAPSCSELARVFEAAVPLPRPGRVLVSVRRAGERQDSCRETFTLPGAAAGR